MPDSGRTGDPINPRVAETAAVHAAHQDVVKLLYMSYWSRWSSAATEADKSSAALLFRSGLNAARIARDMALSLLPGI
jgi:hypothetical protein